MKSKSELAEEFGVGPKKLREMIAECAEQKPAIFNKKHLHRHLVSPKQLAVIYEVHGKPDLQKPKSDADDDKAGQH